MTKARLVLAVFSTSLEEFLIVAIWYWGLPQLGIYLPVPVLIAAMVVWAAFSVSLFMLTSHTLKRQTVVGLPTMIGSRGKVASPLKPEGMVGIRGELWGATSTTGDIGKGEEVEVVGEDGLKLVVRRVGVDKARH